jgi:hypothetical protein
MLTRARLLIAAPVFLGWVSLASPEYNKDIRPLLSENCFACHGPDAAHREAGLRLDVQADAFAAGKSGETAIVPGAPAKSALWQRITTTDADDIMPPSKTHKILTAAQKETLRQWIEAGAKYEVHWAFIVPKRPEVPAGINPVDHFIRRRLREVNHDLAPEADRATLLRRLSFDLTGLPPIPEELDAFRTDSAADAYERQVDRLLASPRFGEHMAAHWLDLARYSDSNGYLQDVRRTGWPWRDWVIQAFNDDMPFDQFVVEQLAGDLLPNADSAQRLATAFLRNHPISVEGGTIEAEYLNEYAADRVETVGTVFLALTMNCCRCHDHKFDPLPQADFYSLLAYFNSSTERHRDNGGTAPAYAPFITVASPLVPKGEKVGVMIMDEGKAPKPTFVLKRGLYDQADKDRPVPRRPPGVLAPPQNLPASRLGLARWLASAENPLLARVTVNRLWQRLFGTGLVASVDDFGVQGDYPSHPDLLDFLAVEFREGWQTKKLMRLIVTSATYRQSANRRPKLDGLDPENRLLGRFPRQRLTAEEIRDAALLSSGLLVEKLGGPPVKPYQPPGLWSEKANPGSTTGRFVRDTGDDLYRRSIYTFHKRTSPPPTMSIFDAPERNSCNARRAPTNTPLQALAAMNDEQHLECARVLAMRTLESNASTEARLSAMFQRVTSRRPSAKDLAALSDGLATFQARFAATPKDATALLKQGEFNNGDPTLLASATVPSGSTPDADGYAYVAIPPVTLRAHGEYLIGGQDSNAFWDSNIAGNPGVAYSTAAVASFVASRYSQGGFTKPVKPGQRDAGRWAVGNAKFSVAGSAAAPLIDFDPAQVDDPADRRGANRYVIGNLFKVGERDIQIVALGLQDADGGAFKGGQVGLWATVAPEGEPGSPELAAWMLIASTILNLDETLVRD